jgi:hypothetical protein
MPTDQLAHQASIIHNGYHELPGYLRPTAP